MDAAIEEMIGRTGVVVPLAAQLLKVIGDSGASDLEITVALALVANLRNATSASPLPEYLQAP